MIKNFFKILFISIILLSCSKDDSGTDTNDRSIIGSWRLINSVTGGKTDLNDCSAQNVITFTENEYEIVSFALSNEGSNECVSFTNKTNYTLNSSKIIFSRGDLQSEFPYDLKNDILTITTTAFSTEDETIESILTYKKI